jgi:hypothetical protein
MENMIGDVCVPNISTVERRKRLASGALALLAGLIALAGLVVLEFNPWWRLALFPLFAAAATGYFQWREKT